MRLLRTVESGTELMSVGVVKCPNAEMTFVVVHRVTTQLELMLALRVRNGGSFREWAPLSTWLASCLETEVMLVYVTVRKLSIQFMGVLRKPLPDRIWLLGSIIGPLTIDCSLCLVMTCVRLVALSVVFAIRGVYCTEQVLRMRRLALL